MNILIVKLSAIGDVIHTLPAANSLREHYPEARLTWLVEEAAAPLIYGHTALDRVLVSRRKTWLRQIRSGAAPEAIRNALAFIRQLRDTRYDLILDFQGLLKSGLLIGLARGGRKIGFGRGMQHQEHSYLFLNELLPAVSMEIHALERNLLMLEPLGITTSTVSYQLPVTGPDRDQARLLTGHAAGEQGGRVVAINPVAKWDTKLWETDKFARLADILGQRGWKIIFTGDGNDREVVDQIRAAMRQPAANLAGRTTLMELAALYEQADLVISTDTGPMHLAAATGTPVVALFGPTAPWRTGPYGDRHQVVRRPLSCSPCYQRTCRTRECLRSITVEEVLVAVDELNGRLAET
ncbi:MAG: lipopolysaccharide heptosyltransferase I [Desulfosudaceae bacterium]